MIKAQIISLFHDEYRECHIDATTAEYKKEIVMRISEAENNSAITLTPAQAKQLGLQIYNLAVECIAAEESETEQLIEDMKEMTLCQANKT